MITSLSTIKNGSNVRAVIVLYYQKVNLSLTETIIYLFFFSSTTICCEFNCKCDLHDPNKRSPANGQFSITSSLWWVIKQIIVEEQQYNSKIIADPPPPSYDSVIQSPIHHAPPSNIFAATTTVTTTASVPMVQPVTPVITPPPTFSQIQYATQPKAENTSLSQPTWEKWSHNDF